MLRYNIPKVILLFPFILEVRPGLNVEIGGMSVSEGLYLLRSEEAVPVCLTTEALSHVTLR